MKAEEPRNEVGSGRSLIKLAVALLATCVSIRAEAQQTCQAGGAGAYCRTSNDCASNAQASVCVDAQCRIPCETDLGDRQPTACSLGETCVAGETEASPVWYCKASAFAMDLNLLDHCVAHFLEGTRPDLTSANVCSLEANLNRMLDQDGNGVFTIFDVDGCLRAYLGQEACAGGVCPGDGVYCEKDDTCGQGLYCNQTFHRCERECGLVGSREDQGQAVLERKCSRPLTVCDYDRGRCVLEKNLSSTLCQVDNDCPAGAVCSMGTCEAKCQRSTDCPDSNWYCSSTSRCMPRPTAAAPSGFVFEPGAYSVLAGTRNVTITAIQQQVTVPLLIMDLISKKQVFDNKAVVFGYRLEAKYALKQDSKCLASPIPGGDLSECRLDPEKEFITLLNPFGVVSAQGRPGLTFALNAAVANSLTPGLHLATITVFFSNGGQDSFTVEYRKTSPSGLYTGKMSIYSGATDNLLGNTDVSLRLFVDRTKTLTWESMVDKQGMPADGGDLRDLTQGYLVTGYIDGNDSMVFDQPRAKAKEDNLVPVRGIYSAGIGRMRLIASVDVPADFCRSDLGDCATLVGANSVRVTNPFGRPIRRVMHFIGPFDERALRFHGLYREVIYGMTPGEAQTLEGEFSLDQRLPDESPVCENKLDAGSGCQVSPLYASPPPRVEFPSNEAILSQVEKDVKAYCDAPSAADAGMPVLAEALKGDGRFQTYLAGICEGGDEDGESCATYGSSRILNQMVRFDSRIADALSSMGEGTQNLGAAMTLNDFLRGRVVLCGDGSANQANCIDGAQARCAMAIHRRALLSGQVSLTLEPRHQPGASDSAPLTEALFCGEGPRDGEGGVGMGCRLNGAKYPTTVALQEHNRFYKQLAQATRYQAANELSDALFAMYRASNQQLERAQVMSYKQTKLQSALAGYNALAAEVFSPVSSDLLDQWPMSRFDSHGAAWLKEFHSVLSDRRQVMTSIIDLKRRVLANSNAADFTFVQHMMHMEYLSQAYLLFLQQRWEGAEFRYEGQGPAALKAGQALVSRVTGDRNPLGLHPQQVYFENANLTTGNWKNYRAEILGGPQGPGLLQNVKASVEGAVTNLKASLRDEAAFMSQLQEARQQFAQTIDGLCGAPDVDTADVDDCELQSEEDRKLAMSCSGKEECLFAYKCDDPRCTTVANVFASGTSEKSLRGTACDLGVDTEYVSVGGGSRMCMRGQMGDAIRQREQLHLQREQIVKKTEGVVRQIAQQAAYIQSVMSKNVLVSMYVQAVAISAQAMNEDIRKANGIFNVLNVVTDMACVAWDCIAKGARALTMGVATDLRDKFVGSVEAAKEKAAADRELFMLEVQQNAELAKERMALDNLTTAVENSVAEYEMVTNSLFSVNARIADTRFLAEEAARRYSETTGSVIDHLIGGMNGDVLQRNKYVQEADAKFQDLLLATYKLTMAFIHSYNLKAQSNEMLNRVFQLMTPEDVAEYLADLDRYEANYCGGAGIDCDSINNVEAFRFSVRDQLFPGLRDIVDARTGALLTKGEQFHNIITSDAYLKTRQRAGQIVKQIEIPFSVWLNDRGTNGAYVQQWMVSPLECNHIIAAGPGGTIAVNVIGTRLRNLTYELGRGNTDYIRQCEPVETVSRDGAIRSDYPINTYIVGYAPQNSLAQRDNTPSYVTHSNGLLACKNVPELGGNVITNESCFKYFARERSLGAPDWTLTVPFGVAYDNDWVFGPDKPIIEDIVIYVRYRTRPI